MDQAVIDRHIADRLVHEIHTSERRSFRNCRRRWDWVYRGMYYPRVTAKPLEFGIAYHGALEVFYHPDTWDWNHDVLAESAIAEFINICEAQRAHYLEVKDDQYITNEEIQTDYDERLVLGVGMLRYHLNTISPEIDTHFKPVRVEVEFCVPIQNPRTHEYLFCTCDQCWKKFCKFHELPLEDADRFDTWEGLPVALAGRVDCLAEDENGDLWIIDWKTARSISNDDEFLYLDDQISSYVMAFRRKLGLNVRGFIYHEQRKAFPEPPTRNKVNRLGRWYSVNQNQAVSKEMYINTVANEDPEAYKAGLYDDFLAFLDLQSPFYKRFQIHRSDIELWNIEDMLFMEAQDMIDPNLRIYPNAGRFNCGFCAFRQPCMERTGGGDFQYILDTMYDKREHHYWVKELSTESQGGE